MSGVQVTPRKRGINGGTRQSEHDDAGGNKVHTAFPPTPPSSRRRRVADDDLDSATQAKARHHSQPRTSLPTHLQTVLSLHRAFNLALSLQLAANPPVLPPHSASTTRLPLPNLTNFLAIKPVVEQSAKRRFGKDEFARLAWIWSWDGGALPSESSANKQDDNPFLVPSTPAPELVCGQSYLITTTRALDPKNRRPVHTHGIGIELEIQPGETRQIFADGAGGFGSRGQGGGIRVLARWNGEADIREDEVVRKLHRWVELNGGSLDEAQPEPAHLPTPSTRDSGRSDIPPIPLFSLPKLPTGPIATHNIFSLASTTSSEPGLTSSPKKTPGTKTTGLSDPFEIKEKKPDTPKGSAAERKQALFQRLKARSEASKVARTTTLGDSIKAGSSIFHHAVDHEELKRRATLSRLEGVAEGVWMLFNAPIPGSGSVGGSPRSVRRKAILMSDVTTAIVKSSKVPISDAEAETSIQMLIDLCPFFIASKRVGRNDWLELRPEAAPSPGSNFLASPTASPLSGVGSPGRVRRSGGLREVRERIRRELGE